MKIKNVCERVNSNKNIYERRERKNVEMKCCIYINRTELIATPLYEKNNIHTGNNAILNIKVHKHILIIFSLSCCF